MSSDRERSESTGSYFPADAVLVAPSSNDPMTTSDVATPLEEVSEGMFNVNIALPMLLAVTPTGMTCEQSPTILLHGETANERLMSHKSGWQSDSSAASPIAACSITSYRRRDS
ncbi:hypothetical protein CERZMDRAFT_98356 [Cercospora zeae-maydis SCOH1-5]|uniref:Uncharacterized protein n=1 Tax=Cercospora zeae-maydis SCOH1-5 TaxID=717836 RepID=A0A6A6FDG4_9PEZI|nr:hypothetical protein CERZMDRAFT_98356 [Cercospora zeae-maydis SCOH1-5]